jgi:uncharacterized membrane protein
MSEPVAATPQNGLTTALPKRRRIEAIDVTRGVALLAMASFHFSWDLEFFGYLDPGTTSHGLLRIYARCIASSFLVLVGISLYLAHGDGIRWRAFLIRFAMVAGAAAAITAVTFLVTPSGFIFFGILHEIALASLLGLAFLRLPAIVTAAAAALVIALPWFVQSAVFDPPELWWLGLSSIGVRSNDYVPVFPWFGPVLAGIALARLASRLGLTDRLAALPIPHTRPLSFIGRHSLVFYLIHQPVLIGGVWTFAQFFPAAVPPPPVQFRAACEAECLNVRDEKFCLRYCQCMLDALEDAGATSQVFAEKQTPEFTDRLQSLANICTGQTDEELEGEGQP